jgi:hypothetical protein
MQRGFGISRCKAFMFIKEITDTLSLLRREERYFIK